jgi:hypothetical protein
VAGVPGKMLIGDGDATSVGGVAGPGAYGLLGDPPPPHAARLSKPANAESQSTGRSQAVRRCSSMISSLMMLS